MLVSTPSGVLEETLYVALGYLVGSNADGSKAVWQDPDLRYSEWDREHLDLLDFLSGVTTAPSLHEYCTQYEIDWEQIEEFLEHGLLIRLHGNPYQQVMGLEGRRLLTISAKEGETQATSEPLTRQPLQYLTTGGFTDDIPTLLKRAAIELDQPAIDLAEQFFLDLDAVVADRVAFISDAW